MAHFEGTLLNSYPVMDRDGSYLKLKITHYDLFVARISQCVTDNSDSLHHSQQVMTHYTFTVSKTKWEILLNTINRFVQ